MPKHCRPRRDRGEEKESPTKTHGTAQSATGTRAASRQVDRENSLVVEKGSIRSAITATVVGNFMEWFDFGIYGYLTVTMTTVFTSGVPRSAGLLLTLFGFAVSFLVRPLGGLVLGPLGDRIGRQHVLFLTMAMMAASTSLIGVLPTSARIGLWAIVPLYLLKMIQGFSAGGEYAGATTYVAESSPDRTRGYYSSWLDVGSYIGFACGAATVAITTLVVKAISGPDAMLDFGWRIPFLAAFPLGAVAIYLRSRIPETPAFEASAQDDAATVDPDDPFARHGLIGIMRHYWRRILICIALVAAAQTVAYALTSYMPTYLEEEVGISNLMSAVATIPVLVVMSVCLPVVGALSDRIGRKPVYIIAVVSTLVLMVPAFAVMQIGTEWAVMCALGLVAIPAVFYLAVSAAALPALFPTASRFGSMALAFNLAVSLFGGTTPFISQWLVQLTGNKYMPAFYIMFFSLIAAVAVWKMPESARKPLLGSPAVVSSDAH